MLIFACVTSKVESESVLEMFKKATYETKWDDHSDLADCIIYCRGSKRLKIPTEWRPWLPTTI